MDRVAVSVMVMIVTLATTSVSAQSTNDNLFRLCAGYFDTSRDYARDWDYFQEVQMPDLERQHSRLTSDFEAERAEVLRLEKILEIMQNSEEVWDKYDRAFRRYERAAEELDAFAEDANYIVNSANAKQDRREAISRQIENECPESWNAVFVRQRCNSGNEDFSAFCFALGL